MIRLVVDAVAAPLLVAAALAAEHAHRRWGAR